MRTVPPHTTRSHHFFTAAQRLLGEEVLAQIWKRSIQQVYRWGADPARCDDLSRNPIDLLQITMEHLVEIGREDVVEGALRVLATPFGYQVAPKDICSDKDSASGEMFDVMTEMGRLSELLTTCRADLTIDDAEGEKLLSVAWKLGREVLELVDAIQQRRA